MIQLLKKEGIEKYLFRGVRCSVLYQGTVPLSTGVRLFGALSFTSVRNRFYVQDYRYHSTWF